VKPVPHGVEEEVRPWSNPASNTRVFLTGYQRAHKLPVSGCVKCRSSPATVSRPGGCEIERVWPNCPRRMMPLVCSEKHAVDVEVETCEVVAHQDQRTIPERADVEFRRGNSRRDGECN
jgi:hypothetical protein